MQATKKNTKEETIRKFKQLLKCKIEDTYENDYY